MDTSTEEEITPLISTHDVPATTRHTRTAYQKQLAMYIILATIVFERTAFYSLEYEMADALQENETLHWSGEHSLHASYILSGTIHIATVVFAVLSDAKVRRFRMILIGFPLYLIAYTLLTLVLSGKICTDPDFSYHKAATVADEKCATWIIPTLILTAIGAGSMRANIFVFGADQIQESKSLSRYVDMYVVVINIASIVLTLIDYYIPDGPQYFFTFFRIAIPMLFFSAILFISGWRYYTHVKPYDSVVSNFIPVVINAFKLWRQRRKKRGLTHRTSTLTALADDSCDFTEEEQSTRIDVRPTTFFDFAKVAHGGKFLDRIVDDVRSLRNAFMIFVLVIPYRLISSQMFAVFASQGAHMHLPKNRPFIADWLVNSSYITTIIGIFILNVFVYNYLHARNRSLTTVNKFLLGMCCAFITMLIASGIEILRQHHCHSNQTHSDLSIFVQLFQYISIGVAQLFATLAIYEFAYFVAPRSAQSLFTALTFCSVGFASYIAVGYNYILKNYSFILDFNCQTLEKNGRHYIAHFLVFGGLQLIFIIIFAACQKKFRMVKVDPQKLERNQYLGIQN